MASTSGQVRTYEVDGGTYFYVNWQQSGQSTSGNYTDINWQLNIHCRWNYYSNSLRINGVNINGSNVKGSETYSNYGQGDHQLASGSARIYHNTDGKKTFNINLSGWVIDGGDTSGSGDFALTDIPRKANITSANNFNDEGTPTMTFSNPGGFTMNAWLEPNPTGTHLCVRNNIPNTGSYTWTLTEEERNQLRQACTGNSCTIRFGLYTIIGSNTYASYVDKTFSIVNGNPVFSDFDFEDINSTTLALTGSNKTNINGYSNIKATITSANKATAQKGATMSKYRFVIGDKSIDIEYSSSSSVNATIEGAPNGTYQVYAIDSRGNSTLVTKLATNVIEYQPVYINASTSKVERNDSGIGENAILTYNGTMWNDDFGQVTNSIKSSSYEYKATSSSTWITPSNPTDITPTLTDNSFSFSNLVRSNEQDYKFDLQTNYDFRITIEDELSTTTLQLTAMPSGIPNLCYADEGMAVMGDYDDSLDSGLQVNGKLYVNGIDILNALYPVGSIYMSVNSTSPSTFFGGTWEQLKDRFLLGAGNTYSNGATGGSATHTLTVDEMPSHSHQQRGFKMFSRSSTDDYAVSWGGDDDQGGSYTRETGRGQPHSIMPPYLVVYMWKRTA